VQQAPTSGVHGSAEGDVAANATSFARHLRGQQVAQHDQVVARGDCSSLYGAMTPAERALRSRTGGLTTASRHDPREYTAAARRAFAARFYDGIPEGLPTAERERRAEAVRRLYMSRLELILLRSRWRLVT
jgi:hypothetical protein